MNSAFKLNNASTGSAFDVGIPSLQVPSSIAPRGSPLKIQQSLALNAAYGTSGEIKIYVEPTVSLTGISGVTFLLNRGLLLPEAL